MKSHFELEDALFIGFCATLLVVLKSMLRLKLGLSGHSMFLMTFFYLLCYGAVGRVGCITACGLLAGIVAMMLSIGKGGPLILLKFGLPAVAMDLTLLMIAGMFKLRWQCVIVALIGCLAWASKGWVENMLAGMTHQIALTKFALNFLQGGVFAIGAALIVPTVLRRLQSHDLLQDHHKQYK
ncbi:core component of ECF transporter [Shewanella sp. Choline-02u-19]|uniref:core component of ECF transporter n=1 Tax=unclassified Shewanella TaxID=196818 RepID=UPI000C32F1B5|nr:MULTISPECIES: core component of ECF transporter [unclassified Shewanella]PKH58185.1 core component of ECF transporter [Shewanella sp. Bg11-22]PKI29552.1 core component of ECF transporter [Shewanella sp. Choline-02u-19]